MIVKKYLIMAEGVSIFYTMDVSLLSELDTIPLYTMDMEKSTFQSTGGYFKKR